MNEEEFLIKIGATIREERRKRKISQIKLAEMAGIDSANISRIETGRTNARISTLKKICDVLKVDIGIVVRAAY